MLTSWLNYVLVALAAMVLVVRHHQLRGTTLVAPWWWAFGSLAALSTVEALVDLAVLEPAHHAAWRFLAATSTLCPGIALLGAKRPQDRSWQWIVASLWLIIALPAIQQLVLHKSGTLEIHPARAWFMLGLILFCVSNSVLSRYWPAVLVAGCGQVGLLGPFLPIPLQSASSSEWTWGIAAISLSVLLTLVGFLARQSARPLDQVWLDFRNWFGLVWSLRFMEQMNAVARQNGWNVVLQWSGFRAFDGSSEWELPPDQARVLRQSLQNLLRRFVSTEWIASRLSSTVLECGDSSPL